MKADKLTFFNDGVCIYAYVKTQSELLGKILLCFVGIIVTGLLILALTEGIILFALANLIVLLGLVRYALWNIYGCENLIINTRTFSYRSDFGFFKTPYKISPLHEQFKIIKAETSVIRGAPTVRLAFVSYSVQTNIPHVLYTSVLMVPETEANALINEINGLFTDNAMQDYGLPDINPN